jgi:anti-sigma regulatory factor (Ser/Thr protein kinase)
MVARPASVPVARRFVGDTLTGWGLAGLVDDAALCVTELSTNATLHSRSRFFEVEVASVDQDVRVSVLDYGAVRARSIAVRTELSAPHGVDLDVETMTGRGLFMVASVANSWGIEDLPDGTRVWAELAHEDGGHLPLQPVVSSRPTPEPAPTRAEDWLVVHLDGCAPDLLLAHDDNLADIVRELHLVGASHPDLASQEAAGQIADVVRRNAVTWDGARLLAREALRAGKSHVDIAVLAPSDVADEVRTLRRAVRAAEAMAEAGALMTPPASESIQRLRDWMEAEFVEQAETGRPPVSFRAFLAERTA